MKLKNVRGYFSIYQGNKCLKYLGKVSKEDADLLIEIMKRRPDLLIGRNKVQAITAYKKIMRREALSKSPQLKIELKLGDFRQLIRDVADDSIDLVLTDPPYPKEYLPLWLDLASESARVLKPGGFLITYSGQVHLPKVLNMLSQYLDYYWLGMLYHIGPTGQRFEVNMWNRAKAILFYYKPPRQKQSAWLEDVLTSKAPNKDNHEWGQSVEPFRKLIEIFCPESGIVLDPFVGGGATIEAVLLTKRQLIAYEIDEQMVSSLRLRFNL